VNINYFNSTNIPVPPYLAYAGVNAATATAAVVQVVKTLAFALKPVPARAHTARLVLLALLLLVLLEVMGVLEVNSRLARPQQRTHGELVKEGVGGRLERTRIFCREKSTKYFLQYG
jgi:hypothetical protein